MVKSSPRYAPTDWWQDTLLLCLHLGCLNSQIFEGAIVGVLLNTWFNHNAQSNDQTFPIILTIPCMMVAVPGAFCPIPLTFVGIGSWYLVLGPQLTSMIFISIFFAYFTLCGTGCISKITRKAAERQAKKDYQERLEIENRKLRSTMQSINQQLSAPNLQIDPAVADQLRSSIAAADIDFDEHVLESSARPSTAGRNSTHTHMPPRKHAGQSDESPDVRES